MGPRLNGLPRGIASVAAVLLVAVAAVRCTAFDDVPDFTPDAGKVGADVVAEAADAPENVLPGLVPIAVALRVCSKVLMCPHVGPSVAVSFGLPIDPTNFSECVGALAGPIDPRRINSLTAERLGCVGNAKGCDVAACVPYEEIDPADPRSPAVADCLDPNAVGRCKGALLTTCEKSLFPNGFWAVHCDDPVYLGGTCTEFTSDAGVALRGTCVSKPTGCSKDVTCRDGSAPASVSEGCITAFTDDTAGSDCAAIGLPCVPLVGCDSPVCAGATRTECKGNRVSTCTRRGSAVSLDCAAVSGTCERKNTTAFCAGPDKECSPYDAPPPDGTGINSCDGARMRLCIGGKKQTVNCKLADPAFECRTLSPPRSNYCGPPQ